MTTAKALIREELRGAEKRSMPLKRLRKRVVRKDPPKRGGKGKENPSPLSAIDAGSPGEIRISNDTLCALNHLYHASPSIQAARTILLGQLLSSGCVVRRDGRDVPLKDTFARHLHDVAYCARL